MKWLTAKEAKNELKITGMTLKRWKDEGRIKTRKMSSKKYLYDIDSVIQNKETDERKNVIYARVSTQKQKESLNTQIEVVKNYMLSNGIKVDSVYSEIASGINDNRQELNRLLKDVADNKIKSVYVSFKDRLTRFGFNYFKEFFQIHSTELCVIDSLEDTNKDFQQELADDLIAIIHHYSSRLYSNRRKKIKEIEKIIQEDNM